MKELKCDDEEYGGIYSNVEFAKVYGYKLERKEWGTITWLSRGGIIESNIPSEVRFQYWDILDAYWEYFRRFPTYYVAKRRLMCRINEGKRIII